MGTIQGMGYDSTNQWTQTTSSSNDVPTVAPSAPSSASGSQGWSQPTTTPTTSSGSSRNVDQASSRVTQTSSTASSADTASSSTTGQSTASSSTTAQSATQEGSDATQTSTNSTSSGAHATFGTITSKSGECVIGNPNTYVSAADIDWVWTNRIGPNAPVREANWKVLDNKNWIMDHIVENKGTLNYCVRWDSTEPLSKSTASKFKAMLERQYAAWNHWLVGYDCWPYNEIKVNVVGFAVKDASLLDWTDDSLGPITGVQGRAFCLTLWPKQGLEGGFGYDWGQEVNLENMLSTLDQDELVIVAHEIGHGFGLPDFYETEDQPNAQWPKCIMMAGSSMAVTDSDGWMLRRVLEHLKPRYNF
ncbi:hypothetical protein PF006_g23002 [Phytophthora fragariae]|uniref:Neutral zinc metallopeptidase n=1 Tax=Phytophthora fragariae TaxID=53985 RepID=A0A6A3RN27_9STRA|nr:hypothetical protein PF009_g9208 [Phytophthora fragariae]KAE9100023.1 hypothetical protein PF006_g23002 [Phytophthora fragariae]